MSKLLHIQASPRGDRSASTTVAKEFLAVYKTKHPDDTIETLDLWKADLPAFEGDRLNAKYAVLSGGTFTDAQKNGWDSLVKITDHFKSADKFLFSVPMWNFGIPYKLKHYVDLLAQPGLTFSFSPDKGYTGLVAGKPAVGIYASGGVYGPGSGMEAYDFQSKYLKVVLGFIGITDLKEVFVGGTAMNKDAVEIGRKTAAEFAANF